MLFLHLDVIYIYYICDFSSTGLGIGFLLRLMVSVTQDQMDWIKFPGDLFFNLLQLFAVPLIVTSVMAGKLKIHTLHVLTCKC